MKDHNAYPAGTDDSWNDSASLQGRTITATRKNTTMPFAKLQEAADLQSQLDQIKNDYLVHWGWNPFGPDGAHDPWFTREWSKQERCRIGQAFPPTALRSSALNIAIRHLDPNGSTLRCWVVLSQ